MNAVAPSPEQPPRRRVLVALDAAVGNLAAVDLVADLAARLHAELTGLMIEDDDLARLAEYADAGLPGIVFSGRRPAATGLLRHALRARLAAGRHALESAAARRRVRTSFEVRRGRLDADMIADAGGADLVVLGGPASHSPFAGLPRAMSVEAVASALAMAGRHSVLLLRPGAHPGGPLVVAYDGSSAGDRAVTMAADLAEVGGGGVEVVLLSNRLDQSRAWGHRIADLLAGSGIHLRFLDLPKADANDLCRVARRDRAGLLIVPAGLKTVAGEVVSTVLAAGGCSVLLVR